MTPPNGHGIPKKKLAVTYANIPSAMCLVTHRVKDFLFQTYHILAFWIMMEASKNSWSVKPFPSRDPDFGPIKDLTQSHKIIQNELNNLLREMEFPKCKVELLGSRLQQWNLLEENVHVFHGWQNDFVHPPFFFKMTDNLIASTNVKGLMILRSTIGKKIWGCSLICPS